MVVEVESRLMNLVRFGGLPIDETQNFLEEEVINLTAGNNVSDATEAFCLVDNFPILFQITANQDKGKIYRHNQVKLL